MTTVSSSRLGRWSDAKSQYEQLSSQEMPTKVATFDSQPDSSYRVMTGRQKLEPAARNRVTPNQGAHAHYCMSEGAGYDPVFLLAKICCATEGNARVCKVVWARGNRARHGREGDWKS
jgi:hypothetical protein